MGAPIFDKIRIATTRSDGRLCHELLAERLHQRQTVLPYPMANHKEYEVSVFSPISLGKEAAIAALVENTPNMNAFLAAKLLSEATPEIPSPIYYGSAHEAGLVAGRLEAVGFKVKYARF